MTKFLNEDFRMSGKTTEGLKKALSYFYKRTYCETVNPINFRIYSIIQRKKNGVECMILQPDLIDLRIMIPKNIHQVYFSRENQNVGFLPYKNLHRATNGQVQDILDAGFFLQYNTGTVVKTMIPSKILLATLCKKLGVGKMDEGIDPFRDLHLAWLMRRADNFKLLYRQDEGLCKAFGCFAEKYTMSKSDTPIQVMNNLKKASGQDVDVGSWKMTHYLTEVFLKYPDFIVEYKGKTLYPGVLLTNSDVGDSSYKLQVGFRLGNSLSATGLKWSQKHGNEPLDVNTFTSEFHKKAYRKLESFTSHLRDASEIPVADLEEKVSESFPSLEKAFGRQNFVKFRDAYPLPRGSGTLMDYYMFLLQIPGYTETNFRSSVYQTVSRSVGDIVFRGGSDGNSRK